MKRYWVVIIILILLMPLVSYAKTPMYSAKVEQGLAKMYDLNGLVTGIHWSNGKITLYEDIGNSGTTTAQVNQDNGSSTGQLATNMTIAGTGTDTATMRTDGVDISPTEKSYLDGATSNIQSQLNSGVNAPIASQAEAEAGTETTKTMTPLRVLQAMTALGYVKSVTDLDNDGWPDYSNGLKGTILNPSDTFTINMPVGKNINLNTFGTGSTNITVPLGIARVIDYTRSVVDINGTTTPKVIYTGTISPNCMGPNGYLEFRAIFVTPSDSGVNEQVNLQIDGVSVAAGSITQSGANTLGIYNSFFVAAGTTSAIYNPRPISFYNGWQSLVYGSSTTAFDSTGTHTYSYIVIGNGTATISLVEAKVLATKLD